MTPSRVPRPVPAGALILAGVLAACAPPDTPASSPGADAAARAGTAYDAFARDWAMTPTPLVSAVRACGPVDTVLTAAPARRAAWDACAAGVTAEFDRPARIAQIAAARDHEARLAQAAGLRAAERIAVAPLSVEMDRLTAARRAVRRGDARIAPARPRAGAAQDPGRPRALGMVGADEGRTAGQAMADADGSDFVRGAATPPTPQAADPAGTLIGTMPTQGPVFAARLAPSAADWKIGQHDAQCVGGFSCETGRVVALIEVEQWCAPEGGMTRTRPGSGIAVQRYTPGPDRRAALAGALASTGQVTAVASGDAATLDAVRAAVGAAEAPELRRAEAPRYFMRYMDFYAENTEVRGCIDAWRDAGQHKVMDNT